MLDEKLKKRGKLIAEVRAVFTKAKEENRSMTGEELDKTEKIQNELRTLQKEIDVEKQLIEDERTAAELAAPEERSQEKGKQPSIEEKRMEEFRNYICTNRPPQYDDELRAVQETSDTKGGFLVPEQFYNTLIKNVDDVTFIRQKATKIPLTKGYSIGSPTLTTKAANAVWGSEISTTSEDATLRFGKRSLTVHPFSTLILVSNDILEDSQEFAVDTIVTGEMSRAFGYAEEEAYMNGDGAQKPLGLFTASNDGIGTSQDVSTDNTTTEITFKNLKRVKYKVPQQYHPRCEWIFHTDAMVQLALIVDGEGRFMLQDSVTAGEPDRIFGHRVNLSEFAPNTFTTGQYVGLFGDLSQYWIVERGNLMDMKRLGELYALSNKIGFIGRRRVDGAPVKAEAFARVTLA